MPFVSPVLRLTAALCLIAVAVTSETPTATLTPNPDWGREPVEELTTRRGRIVLSGVWNFLPAGGQATEGTYGAIRVPGSWKQSNLPGVTARGTGPAWSAELNGLTAAWYSRLVTVPAGWGDRTVVLELTRLSTDAIVYVDGRECGRIGESYGSPAFGSVDVTAHVRPGQPARLDILVSAGLKQAEVELMMGTGAGQQLKVKANLPACGIIGDAILYSHPRGAHVSDVFVQPSVRRKEVRLDIELSGIAQAGTAAFSAEMVDEQGRVEKTLRASAAVKAAAVQTVTVTLPWTDPRLWDVGTPNLYTLRLAATSTGLDDAYWQPFGFREFWIDGRQFMLNGTPFRLRPCFRDMHFGYPELIDAQIDADLAMGFNFQELWPADPYATLVFQDVVAERADRKGWPISGITMPIQRLASTWEQPEVREKFIHLLRREVRRLRNHPSLFMWGSSGNFFMHEQDQDPRHLGRQDWIPAGEQEAWQYGSRPVSRQIVARMKEEDPTRPVFMHAGTHVGDFPTANCYLNFLPLQEREEWLSAWATSGTSPWLVVEMGLPLGFSFLRDRGFAMVTTGERLYTEHLATTMGPSAFLSEDEATRSFHRDFYHDDASANPTARNISANLWKEFWPKGRWLHTHWNMAPYHGSPGLIKSPAFNEFMALFIRNTWRSWRTQGSTSLPIPWTFPRSGWSYPGDAEAKIAFPPFQPGRRGAWVAEKPQSAFFSVPGKTWTLSPEAAAMQQVNSPTLAWISGPKAAFTAKDHSYWSGQTIEKSLALLNDERKPQRYDLTWTVTVGGRQVGSGRVEGELAVGETRLLPVQAALTSPVKCDGAVELNGTIGARRHADRFAFRVFPRLAASSGRLRVHDPVGKTTAMLTTLGFAVEAWDGRASDSLVVIGREALTRPLPGDLKALVAGGGRVLVMAQPPEWTRDALGLRVARHMSRRVFRVTPTNPVVAGLDDEDLRDWAGVSTLVEAYPASSTVDKATPYGWKWGNRGGLTSGAIEKPHLSGWRPLLECEFDLAYSPLLELDHGKGRMLWCALDLEDYVPAEPAAVTLARQLLAYAAEAPLRPRLTEITVLGTATPLAGLGLTQPVNTKLPAADGVVVVAGDAVVDEAALRAFLERGGRALFLARSGAQAPLGVTLSETADAGRAVPLPTWPELAGLSLSDLHARAPFRAWVVSGGAETAAGGLLARLPVGKGVAIFCQLAPDRLDTNAEPYLRFVRWRQTRTVMQLLANLGAAFTLDAAIPGLRSATDRLSLAGTWQVQPLALVKGSRDIGQKPPITPISAAALALVGPKIDDAGWASCTVPGMWPGFDNEMYGEAVFRRTVAIPAEWAGKDLTVTLGALDDADTTFWNGEQIGTGSGWNKARRYTVPGRLVTAGTNLLAVRIFNNYLAGGFNGKPEEVHVALSDNSGGQPCGHYHQDYRTDFELGDDPYRYQRW